MLMYHLTKITTVWY